MTAQITNVIATWDVVRLYPSVNIAKCIIFLCTYLQERITAQDPKVDMTPATLALFHDMCDVILNENYCRFASTTFRAVQGFPTGLACGRTFAEIYLHMIERQLWSTFSASMSFARRYIDDGTAVFPDEASARAFIEAYGKLDADVKITSCLILWQIGQLCRISQGDS